MNYSGRKTFASGIGWVLLCLLVGFTRAAPVFAAIDVYEFESAEQEAEFAEIIAELRCPKCQNQNLADSNAEIAKDLKNKTYQLLNQGKSKQEIVSFLADRYGDFISYRPPLNLRTGVLWFGPLLLFLLVLAIVVYRVRRNTVRFTIDDEVDRQRLKDILQDDSD